MITWSQRILNETLHSALDRPRVGGRFFEIDSSSIDEGASRIHIIFKETDYACGVWKESASLSFDKWVRAHQTVLESDEFKGSVAGMWKDLEGGGEVSTREAGDMTIDLERWHSPGTYRLSIRSRNPASISSDDFTAEGESIKWLLRQALRGISELSAHNFKIGAARLDESSGALCISVGSDDTGRYDPGVVVADDLRLDGEAQTFIEQNKARLENYIVAEMLLAGQLRQVLTGGPGPSGIVRWDHEPTTVKLVSRDGSKTDFEILFTPRAPE